MSLAICPTIMLLDHTLECAASGHKAKTKYQQHKRSKHPEQFNNYYLFEHFKMSLYEEKVGNCKTVVVGIIIVVVEVACM